MAGEVRGWARRSYCRKRAAFHIHHPGSGEYCANPDPDIANCNRYAIYADADTHTDSSADGRAAVKRASAGYRYGYSPTDPNALDLLWIATEQ